MNAIRIFVTDDYPMIRHGLAAMLSGEPGLRWIGEASSGAEAVRLAPGLVPHVVLVDLDMPEMDGVATIQALRPLLPDARFVLMLSQPDRSTAGRVKEAGAVGSLLKSATPAELVGALRAANQGLSLPSAEWMDGAEQDADNPSSKLTQRERELLGLMARGLSNQHIAEQLSIAMPTVKFHVTNILTKMSADNRTEAVLAALRHKIVTLD